MNANLSHAKFAVNIAQDPGTITFKDANLVDADLSGLALQALAGSRGEW